MLEGVGGQLDPAALVRLVQRRPVDVEAPGVHGGQGGQQAGQRVGVLPAGRDERGVHGVRQTVGAQGGQDGCGTQFEEGVGTLRGQRGDGVGEAHGLPHVPYPVVGGAEFGGGGRGAGESGDDRHGRFGGLDAGHDLPERGQHGLHAG